MSGHLANDKFFLVEKVEYFVKTDHFVIIKVKFFEEAFPILFVQNRILIQVDHLNERHGKIRSFYNWFKHVSFILRVKTRWFFRWSPMTLAILFTFTHVKPTIFTEFFSITVVCHAHTIFKLKMSRWFSMRSTELLDVASENSIKLVNSYIVIRPSNFVKYVFKALILDQVLLISFKNRKKVVHGSIYHNFRIGVGFRKRYLFLF